MRRERLQYDISVTCDCVRSFRETNRDVLAIIQMTGMLTSQRCEISKT